MSVLAAQLAKGLLALGQDVDDLFRERGGDSSPDPGSEGAQEQQTSFGSSQGGTDLTIGIVWVTLGIPSDHLQAASRLIGQGGDTAVHRYAVLSCLRVILEVASIGFWLIQPGIGPRKRMERTLTFARNSVTQRTRAERLRRNLDDLSNLGMMREAIGRVAAENGLRRLTGERERRIPDAAQLIGDQFDCIGRSRRDAISVYGLLSEFTHGTFLGSILGSRQHTTDDTALRPGVPLGEIALAADYASVGLSSTIGAFVGYMGWDAEAWRDKAQPHLSTIEGVAHVMRDIR